MTNKYQGSIFQRIIFVFILLIITLASVIIGLISNNLIIAYLVYNQIFPYLVYNQIFAGIIGFVIGVLFYAKATDYLALKYNKAMGFRNRWRFC